VAAGWRSEYHCQQDQSIIAFTLTLATTMTTQPQPISPQPSPSQSHFTPPPSAAVPHSIVLLDDLQLHFFNASYDSFLDGLEHFAQRRKAAYEKQQKWIHARLQDAGGKLRCAAAAAADSAAVAAFVAVFPQPQRARYFAWWFSPDSPTRLVCACCCADWQQC
jgi:hypothetical protein